MSRFATAAEALEHWAESRGHQPAYVFYGNEGKASELSWHKLHELSGRWAAVLRRDGIGRGKLVFNTLLNSPERLVTEVATMMAGAATVDGSIWELQNPDEFLHSLKQSQATTVVVDPDICEGPWSMIRTHVIRGKDNMVKLPELPNLKSVYMIRRDASRGEESFWKKLSQSKEFHSGEDVKPDDVCGIFYTFLKAVDEDKIPAYHLNVHTHESIAGFASSIPIWQNGEGKVEINFYPMGDICGTPFIPMFSGVTRVAFDSRTSGEPQNVFQIMWDASMEQRCNISVINTRILEHFPNELCQKLDSGRKRSSKKDYKLDEIMLLGVPLTSQELKSVRKLFAKTVYTGYGCCDFGLATLQAINFANFTDFDMGSLLPGVDLKVVWREASGKELEMPVGAKGQILVKTPTMMKEYLNDPEATAAVMTEDGYFRTGHIGSVNQHGHLLVEGKGSNAILRGPIAIYPDWLENRIKTYRGVQDIAIVGVPGPNSQEELCVCLVLDAHVSAKDIQELVDNEIITEDHDPLCPRPLHYIKLESSAPGKFALPNRVFVKEFAVQFLQLNTTQA